MNEDDTYHRLIQTPFREVLDAHRALNLATNDQLEALYKAHHWTKQEYNEALNKYYTEVIGQPIEIQIGVESESDMIKEYIYKKK